MKTIDIVLLLSILSAQLISVKSVSCNANDVELSTGKIEGQGEIKLSKKREELTIKMLKTDACEITVLPFNDMEMKMTVKTYTLGEEDCSQSGIEAGVEKAKYTLQVCKSADAGRSITSTKKALYLKLKASKAQTNVVLDFLSIQGNECGESEIVLNQPTKTIKFPATTFTKLSDCDVTVKSIDKRVFKMTVQNIDLDIDMCQNNYMAASTKAFTTEVPTDKICKKSDVTGPISATGGELYLKIVTKDPKPTTEVTLLFELEYPECGKSDFEVPDNGLELLLPPTDKPFKDDTLCNITVSGKEGKNVSMTITEIQFADNGCTNDYVSASPSNNLPNANYRKCGKSPVTDPIQSNNGKLYVQIKTGTSKEDVKVKLQFNIVSGAGKPGQYALVTILLFKLLSVTLC